MNRKRLWLLAALLPLAIAGAIALALSPAAHAQDTSVLKPPPGAKLGLVVFEDLECPMCARQNPLLEQAARTYKIPLVRYDFPLTMHVWSFDAAVLGHYFDSKSKKLGEEFRDFIFQHQAEVTKENLRGFAERFAQEHNVDLPFAIDPHGRLAAEVKENQELGERVGIKHTPTIYLVTNGRSGPSFVEVENPSRDLFQMIDSAKAEAE